MTTSPVRRASMLPAVAISLVLGGAALAALPHLPIRATIASVDGDVLKLTTRDGQEVVVLVTPDAKVTALVRATLADIKPNSYVGMANRVQPDGSQVAIEVHIFPEAGRGTGDGERLYDMGADSKMTNGAITGDVTGVDGRQMTVKYANGESKILVTPKTPIVAYEPGDRAELKPGNKVIIRIVKAMPDGGLETNAVTVGRDGLTPPM